MDESTLVLVQVVFRHGVRAPDYTYPGDPYKNVTFQPFGKGKLTKEGRKQSYDFGKELRKRYHTFLGPEYHDDIMEANSSEVARAQVTLQLVLAGLFPPTETTKITKDLNWQPISYNYKPLMEDPLFGCMIAQVLQSKDHAGFKTSQTSIELIKLLEEKLGWSVEHFSQIMILYDTIRTQVDLGLQMPEWIADVFEDKLYKEVKCYISENMERRDYLKKGCGGLMTKILSEMESRAANSVEGKPKMILYSGHDINVIGLMKVLQFSGFVWPLYMGSLTFELHCVKNEYFVKVVFIDGYVPQKEETVRSIKPNVIKSPNDEETWLLPQLRKHVETTFEHLSNNSP